jgi:hypothetical protein
MLEQLRQHANVRSGVPDISRLGRANTLRASRRNVSVGSISSEVRHLHLNADIPIPVLHRLPSLVFYFLEIPT